MPYHTNNYEYLVYFTDRTDFRKPKRSCKMFSIKRQGISSVTVYIVLNHQVVLDYHIISWILTPCLTMWEIW
jgi:hypothetical protein